MCPRLHFESFNLSDPGRYHDHDHDDHRSRSNDLFEKHWVPRFIILGIQIQAEKLTFHEHRRRVFIALQNLIFRVRAYQIVTFEDIGEGTKK